MLCEKCVHSDVCIHKCILGLDVEGVKCCLHFICKYDLVSSSLMTRLFELEAYHKTHYEDIKTEVAREIFEEIECAMRLKEFEHRPFQGNEYLKYYNASLMDDIKKLKKKYTEGEK